MKEGLSFAGYKKGLNDNTQTPNWLYKQLNSEFHFDFDPCPFIKPEWDGLVVEWGESNFVNPPYSNKEHWIMKSLIEWRKGKLVVILLPVDTSTGWFHDWIKPYHDEIRFIRKRLIYPPNNKPAKYPSMIVVFRPMKEYANHDIKT